MNFWFSPPVWFVLFCACGPLALVGAETADSAGPAQKPIAACDRADDLWLVSTRQACYECGSDPSAYELDVRHRVDGEWVTTPLAELLALPPAPTTLYVHGNRIEWCEAFDHGQQVYQSLAGCCPEPPSMRFIIWTWPSDQIRRALRDVRVKAERADGETFLLAGFLARLPQGTPVNLIGYSYGARVVTGGLHLLAGGSLGGRGLPAGMNREAESCRVALVAPAMDQDWLCATGCHGLAAQQAAAMLLLYNTCDPALQRYRFVEPCSRATALGYAGLPDHCEVWGPIEQFDAAPYAGRSHDEQNYFCSETLRLEICRVLFAPLADSPLPKGNPAQ